jgi:hypothetical protein
MFPFVAHTKIEQARGLTKRHRLTDFRKTGCTAAQSSKLLLDLGAASYPQHEISRTNPSAFLFVMDQSGPMDDRVEEQKTKLLPRQLLMQDARNDQLFRPVRS